MLLYVNHEEDIFEYFIIITFLKLEFGDVPRNSN